MNNLTELEREVWTQIKGATEKHNTLRLAHFSALAADIDVAKNDWVARLEAGLKMNGAGRAPDRRIAPRPDREPATGPDDDFTGKPIRGFAFDGAQFAVSTYKELLIQLTNLLRKKFGEDFDDRALSLGGRKRRYFSRQPRELKYAHEVEGGGLFVETNLNANLIVKICYRLVRDLGCDGKLKIW